MTSIQQRFEVERSLAAVYDALSQPQAVLQGLPGVTGVRRVSDDAYHITGGSLGSPREVELQITEKVPPRRIAWRSADGLWTGVFELEPLAAARTAVSVSAEIMGGAEGEPSAAAMHDGLQALKRALQPPHIRIETSGSGYGAYGSSARRYASEWRDTAQTAFTRPTEFPFKLMRTVTRQVDRVLGDVWRGTPISRLPNFVPGMPWNPDVEVCEQDDQVRVCIDVPGVDESQLQVEIDERTLVIRGERHDERASDPGHRRSELHYGSFSRRIPLPDGVDADAARAILRNGVLEIRIPMHRRAPRRVPVQHVPQ
ncbi:MAG TPA: Hsp20 family protein [Burkholderiales bacterium]|nr:Hsp20 family protein [Burkholderiales bacterium]